MVDPYAPNGAGIATLENFEKAHNLNQWLADHFSPYLGSSNLEIGSGTGTISNIVMRKFNIELCENSQENIKTLQQRFSKTNPIIHRDYFAIEKQNHYDCIFSANVLEHFDNDLEVLFKANELLKPGGYFAAYVPAGNWLFSDFDKSIGHFRRYGKKEIQRLNMGLKEKGEPFKLQQSRYFNILGAFAWLIKMKWLGSQEINPNDIVTYDKIFPYIRWLDLFSFQKFGQNLLLVWEKK